MSSEEQQDLRATALSMRLFQAHAEGKTINNGDYCHWDTGWEGVTSNISSRWRGAITEQCPDEYSQDRLWIRV